MVVNSTRTPYILPASNILMTTQHFYGRPISLMGGSSVLHLPIIFWVPHVVLQSPTLFSAGFFFLATYLFYAIVPFLLHIRSHLAKQGIDFCFFFTSTTTPVQYIVPTGILFLYCIATFIVNYHIQLLVIWFQQ